MKGVITGHINLYNKTHTYTHSRSVLPQSMLDTTRVNYSVVLVRKREGARERETCPH